MLRVAYIAGLDPSRKFGFLEEQILILAGAVRERGGCLVPVFASPLGGEAEREYGAAGVATEALDLRRFRPGTLRALLALLDRHQIEVVHWAFYHPFNPFVWALTALRPRLRHYLTDHNSRYPQPQGAPARTRSRNAVRNALFARYERIVCVSDFVAASLRREGVRAELYAVRPLHQHRALPARRLGARARARGARGGRALRRDPRRLPDRGEGRRRAAARRGAPAGGGLDLGRRRRPEAERLKALARELAIERRVLFLATARKVQPFLQAADCLVCPSLWQEAAGLVNIEGLACGLPVVASDTGGIPEIVDEGRTGLLVSQGDSDALAAAIHRLYDDPGLRARMGRDARRAALERFAPERTTAGFPRSLSGPARRSVWPMIS